MKKYWSDDYQSFVYNDCSYDDMRQLVKNGMLGFCGCVCDSVVDKCRDVLCDLIRPEYRSDGEWVGWDDLLNKHFMSDEACGYFVLQYMQDRGLIEHGTSIRFSWITDKGNDVLEAIEWIESQPTSDETNTPQAQ